MNIIIPEHVGSNSLFNHAHLLPPDGELTFLRNNATETHENVSLCSIGVCHFARLSSSLAPQSLVRFLNEFVSIVNGLALKYNGLVKIRMLGDTYFIVAGLNSSGSTSATNIEQLLSLIEFSLDVQQTIKNHRFRVEKTVLLNINVKIGIHFGNIVTGIVGKLRPVKIIFIFISFIIIIKYFLAL